jgi:hypothetical protein
MNNATRTIKTNWRSDREYSKLFCFYDNLEKTEYFVNSENKESLILTFSFVTTSMINDINTELGSDIHAFFPLDNAIKVYVHLEKVQLDWIKKSKKPKMYHFG